MQVGTLAKFSPKGESSTRLKTGYMIWGESCEGWLLAGACLRGMQSRDILLQLASARVHKSSEEYWSLESGSSSPALKGRIGEKVSLPLFSGLSSSDLGFRYRKFTPQAGDADVSVAAGGPGGEIGRAKHG